MHPYPTVSGERPYVQKISRRKALKIGATPLLLLPLTTFLVSACQPPGYGHLFRSNDGDRLCDFVYPDGTVCGQNH